ncbi:MAG: polyhydroxyalkanoic acid system family protein [Planctomycetaceae bacterium]|jgi:hypothetical protein|nr:polyhydroxyalkanoic acid system family protein [Planctomycetaceae bacterium]
MSLLNVEVSHSLPRSEATERLKKKEQEIKEQRTYTVSDLTENWLDPDTLEFAFKVYGFSITGSVRSQEHSVALSIDLPVAAAMMKGMIESQVRKELTNVLT